MKVNEVLRKLHEHRRRGYGDEEVRVLIRLGDSDPETTVRELVGYRLETKEEITDMGHDDPMESSDFLIEIIL
jgi:hypothetical protein